MKYFSVDFIPEKRDINKKALLINLFAVDKNKLIPKLLIICMLIIFAFFIGQYELIFYVFLSLFIVPKITEIILILSQIKKGESELSKRPVTIDFYGDHFIYRYNSTIRFKGNFEKHYAFSKVTNVIDSSNAIAFAFGESDTVLIPKRALDAEKNIMIANLIENLFKNKFIRVDI